MWFFNKKGIYASTTVLIVTFISVWCSFSPIASQIRKSRKSCWNGGEQGSKSHEIRTGDLQQARQDLVPDAPREDGKQASFGGILTYIRTLKTFTPSTFIEGHISLRCEWRFCNCLILVWMGIVESNDGNHRGARRETSEREGEEEAWTCRGTLSSLLA